MDGRKQSTNAFENFIFACLGGMVSLIFSLHLFETPSALHSKDRSPASEINITPEEEFNPELYRF